MASLCVFAPAKINLFLAITGRRADGFHELISLVAPLGWGDTLWMEPSPGLTEDLLNCASPEVPTDATNLVLRAAATFRRRTGRAAPPPLRFTLLKEVPAGAGLGGGSSDGAAALRGMNHFCASPLSEEKLRECAAEIGSDVALFLENGPVVMRGRGERVEKLPAPARAALSGREIILFKPPFPIPTAWAYGKMREHAPDWYVPAAEAEARMAAWLAAPDWETLPLQNNLELPAFGKFLALPALLDALRERFNLRCRMSGSGSACFAILEPSTPCAEIEKSIRDAWGSGAFIRRVRLA